MSRMMMLGCGAGAGASPLLTDLISYWKMDEASGKAIDAHNTSKISAQFVAASDQYLSRSDNADLSTGDVDYWGSAWVNLDTKNTYRAIMAKGSSGAFEYWCGFDHTVDRFVFTVYTLNGGTFWTATANNYGSVPVGVWHHVVFYHDSVSNEVGIAVNGGNFNTTATTGVPGDGTAEFQIGRGQSLRMDGRINLAAWGKNPVGGVSGVKNAIKTSLYNSGLGKYYISLTSSEKTDWGLVSYWNLDEASGSRADSHGSNTLTDNNSTGSGVGVGCNDFTDNNTVTSVSGVINTARQFTAANSEYFRVASSPSLRTGDIDFTIAFWVSFTNIADGITRYLAVKDQPSAREWGIYKNDTGSTLHFYVTHDGSTVTQTPSTTGGNAFQLIICWHDSVNNTINLQRNNGTVLSTSHSSGVFGTNSSLFLSGYNGSSNFHNGAIDEMGFWKRILTAQERTQLYNNGNGLAYPFS